MATLAAPRAEAVVERLAVSAYEIPTDAPEADGTLEWELDHAGRRRGRGGRRDRARLHLRAMRRPRDSSRRVSPIVVDGPRRARRARPRGRAMGARSATSAGPGSARWRSRPSMSALWDLKAQAARAAAGASCSAARRDAVPVYGSGGFTSYSLDQLREQLGGWVEQGIPRVKMKIGARPGRRPGARPSRSRRRSATARAVRRRQRRLLAQSRRWTWPSASPSWA